ncbi:MAG: hypothetical protein ACTJLK_03370 [Anaplasma sp.]
MAAILGLRDKKIDAGKRFLPDPSFLYKGRGGEPLEAPLELLNSLIGSLDSKQRAMVKDHLQDRPLSEELLVEGFMLCSNLKSHGESKIPEKIWHVFVKIFEATPKHREFLTKFVESCIEETPGKKWRVEGSPTSEVSIGPVAPRWWSAIFRKHRTPDEEVYVLMEKSLFTVRDYRSDAVVGTLEVYTECMIHESGRHTQMAKVYRPSVTIRVVGAPLNNKKRPSTYWRMSDALKDLCARGVKAGTLPMSDACTSILSPAKLEVDWVDEAAKYYVSIYTPRRDARVVSVHENMLTRSSRYTQQVFNSPDEDYTPSVIKMLVGPVFGIPVGSVVIQSHNTRSSGVSDSVYYVEKRAVVADQFGRNSHVVLRYKLIKEQDSKGNAKAYKIEDIKLYVKQAKQIANSSFLSKERITMDHGFDVYTWRSSRSNSKYVWTDAATAQSFGASKSVRYALSEHDLWDLSTDVGKLQDAYRRYKAAHSDQRIIREGVVPEVLEFLASQVVFLCGQNDHPLLDVEEHIVAHRGVVCGNDIVEDYRGSCHRIEEHFTLQIQARERPAHKVHAFVSYYVYDYDWNEEKKIVASLGGVQLGVRFVDQAFELRDCLNVDNQGIDSGIFKLFRIDCEEVQVECDALRRAIGNLESSAENALFVVDTKKPTRKDKKSVETKIVNLQEKTKEYLTKYFIDVPDGKEEESSRKVVGELVPTTSESAQNAIENFADLLRNDFLLVILPTSGKEHAKKPESYVRFVPKVVVDDNSAFAKSRMEILQPLADIWMKGSDNPIHVSLLEALVNSCSNLLYEDFAKFLMAQYGGSKTSPNDLLIVDRKVFLKRERPGTNDHHKDGIRIVQHALISPMMWWGGSENIHLVVDYKVCVTQLEDGREQLQISDPIVAVRLSDATDLSQCTAVHSSVKKLESDKFCVVGVPESYIPEPVTVSQILQSSKEEFGGYGYETVRCGRHPDKKEPGDLSESEKLHFCMSEFVRLNGIGELFENQAVSIAMRRSPATGFAKELRAMTAQNYDRYSGLVGALTRVDYSKFAEFCHETMGTSDVRGLDTDDSGLTVTPSAAVTSRSIPDSCGIALERELSFRMQEKKVDATISCDLLALDAPDGRQMFVISNVSVRTEVKDAQGGIVGKAVLFFDDLDDFKTVVEVRDMRQQMHQPRKSLGESRARKAGKRRVLWDNLQLQSIEEHAIAETEGEDPESKEVAVPLLKLGKESIDITIQGEAGKLPEGADEDAIRAANEAMAERRAAALANTKPYIERRNKRAMGPAYIDEEELIPIMSDPAEEIPPHVNWRVGDDSDSQSSHDKSYDEEEVVSRFRVAHCMRRALLWALRLVLMILVSPFVVLAFIFSGCSTNHAARDWFCWDSSSNSHTQNSSAIGAGGGGMRASAVESNIAGEERSPFVRNRGKTSPATARSARLREREERMARCRSRRGEGRMDFLEEEEDAALADDVVVIGAPKDDKGRDTGKSMPSATVYGTDSKIVGGRISVRAEDGPLR